jgi:hypothetical protein
VFAASITEIRGAAVSSREINVKYASCLIEIVWQNMERIRIVLCLKFLTKTCVGSGSFVCFLNVNKAVPEPDFYPIFAKNSAPDPNQVVHNVLLKDVPNPDCHVQI